MNDDIERRLQRCERKVALLFLWQVGLVGAFRLGWWMK